MEGRAGNKENAFLEKDPGDTDLTFLLGLYQDLPLARRALSWVRTHYPSSRIIVRSDGDENVENKSLVDDFGVDYFVGERLYPYQNGGKMIEAMLQLFHQSPTRYLIKMDTDTALHRRFGSLPSQHGLFGSIQQAPNRALSIQGGGVGMTDLCVKQILESRLLQDSRLQDPRKYRHESIYFSRLKGRVKRTGLTSFDWVLGWVCVELDIPQFDCREFYCRGLIEHSHPNKNLEYALTHPAFKHGSKVGEISEL